MYRNGQPFQGREQLIALDRAGTGEPQDVYFPFLYQRFDEASQRASCVCLRSNRAGARPASGASSPSGLSGAQ